MPETPTIYLRRKASLASCLRKFDVLVDGKKVGTISNGKNESFTIAPGRHTVQTKMLSRSELVEIDVAPNDTVDLECGVPAQFWIANGFAFPFAAVSCSLMGNTETTQIIGYVLFAMVFIFLCVMNFRPGGTYYLKKIDPV